MLASTKHIGRLILFLGFLSGSLGSLHSQVASYNFNENAEDQASGHHATIFGNPSFENGEYISFTPGEYLSLPLAVSEAIDVSESWQFEFRFKVEGDWLASEGEEAQVILASKTFDRRWGGFTITAQEWHEQLQLITTFGDGITYPPNGCATCGPHEGSSEGKADFVIDIDSDIWYDVKIKFFYGSEEPYIQYEVNGTIFISYWNLEDPHADPWGFQQTINQQQIWVGTDQDNKAIERTNRPKMDLQLDHLSFWSPVPAGNPDKVGTVLQALVEDMHLKFDEGGIATNGFTELQQDSLRQEFVRNWDDHAYEANTAIIWEYIHTYAKYHEPIFTEWYLPSLPQEFTPLEAIQFIMEQWILDNRYGPETVSDMEGLTFEDHELFPGKVSGFAPRITDHTFTINGDYQTNPGFYNNGQEQVIRPSGYYVPPGELVTITIPDAVVDQGLSLYVGAHNVNLATTWNVFRRFPRIMTTYELNAKTITVSNPFGGGIYIKVPDGSSYGPLEFEVSGAVKAPYYSDVEGFSHSLEAFNADLANQYVPWSDIESKNMMATITAGTAVTIEDMDSVFSVWNQSFDGVNIALGRPVERFRAEYFLIDRQNHYNGTIPASYPMPFEEYARPYEAREKMPIVAEKGRDWYNEPQNENFFMIIMHEMGHLHNMPTLPNEVESNVNLLATAALSHAMGESVDSAFVYSIDQRLNLDQAAMDWVLLDNFYKGNRIGYLEESERYDELEQRYQSRGFAKYVDIANLFGWEALGSTFKPFYDRRTADPLWSPYSLQDDEYIEAASNALGFNMAPHFEFWGIIPSDELVASLSEMPTSEVIKDRIIHFRSLVPANNDEFQDLHRVMTSKLPWFNDIVYDEWKTSYDEARAQRIIDRFDEILNKYYDINDLDYNVNPVITGLSEELYVTINSTLELTLENFVIEDPDNNYPEDFTLNVLVGNNYVISGTTITPEVDFTGELIVPVTVNDGLEDSEQFSAVVTVVIENDRPVITGLVNALSTNEDNPITLSLDDFLVNDSDHNYPSDFTLTVRDGDNYSLSGTTITPDTDFNEQLTVSVTVSDGIQKSKPFEFEIEVIPVNDRPRIIGVAELFEIEEDQSISFRQHDFRIDDPDQLSRQFDIEFLEGESYSVENKTLTPARDFYGRLRVQVRASDNTDYGEVFEFFIQVNPVNDQPVITGPVDPLATKMDQSITLELADITVTDPDNDFPNDFTLTVLEGDNYSVSATTVTPDPSFTGELNVSVVVNDGELDSDPTNVTINVIPPNDNPVITGQRELSTNEDTPITLAINDLTVEDSDHTYPDDFTLRLYEGDNYTLPAGGSLEITPGLNFFGELIVPVTVSDGIEESEPFMVTVTVNSVNDAPVILTWAGFDGSVSTMEDTPITLTLDLLEVEDPDHSYPDDFTLLIEAGENYSASGSTVTPATDYFGQLNIPVKVNDGEDDSESFILGIIVNSVNDVPVISGIVEALTIEEDSELSLSLDDLVVVDPDNNYPGDFTMSIGEGENYSISGGGGQVVTPDPNFFGELMVPVTVSDGIEESEQFILIIEVIAVNDKPVITDQRTELVATEDTPFNLSLSDLEVEDPDNTFPDDFTLTIEDGNSYTVDGLTVTPAEDFDGTLSVSVTVNDGSDSSEPFTIEIPVTPVNDAPMITGLVEPLTTEVDMSLELSLEDFIIDDPDSDFPKDFTLSIQEGENYTLSGFTVIPGSGFIGDLLIPVTVNDGSLDSEPFQATVEVAEVLGIDNGFVKRHFSVTPNPTTDQLSIVKDQGVLYYHFNLLSLKGDLVYSGKSVTKEIETIDLRGLSNGFYILQITSPEGVGTFKVMKR